MKFVNVSMENFLSVGEQTTVPLDIKGLVLLSGNNKDAPKADSNGSGKSTSISSITYACWGQCINGLKADEVVHSKVGKDCKVVLSLLDDNGTPVSITRTRKDSTSAKANDLILEVNGIDISSSTVEETQEKITNLLGMDFATFCAMMPGCGVNVATLTDKEIKTLLEKVLHTEELSEAHKLAVDRYKSLDKELAVNKSSLSEQKSNLANAKVRLMGYQQRRDSFENQKSIDIELAKDQLKEREAESVAAKTKLPVEPSSSSEDTLVALQEDLDTKQKTVTELETKIQKTDKDYNKKSSSISTEISLIQKNITAFLALDVCPTCQLEVHEEHKSHLVEDLSTNKISLENRSTRLDKDYTALSTAYEKKLKKAKLELEAAKKAKAKAQEDRSAEASKRREYEVLLGVLESSQKAVEQAKRNLLRVESQENQFVELFLSETEVVKSLEAKIAALHVEILSQDKQLKMLKFWVDSFSPSGIRSYMLSQVTPYLNDRAQYYSQILTSNEMKVVFNTQVQQKGGKVAEKFNIEVSQAHGSSNFKGSSGGEKARANLVVALTIADLASLRSSKKLRWRVIDEALDPIDSAGDEAVIELLSQMGETCDSIYLVSHKDSLKNRIPMEIIMAKQDGFSYVQEIKERDIH